MLVEMDARAKRARGQLPIGRPRQVGRHQECQQQPDQTRAGNQVQKRLAYSLTPGMTNRWPLTPMYLATACSACV